MHLIISSGALLKRSGGFLGARDLTNLHQHKAQSSFAQSLRRNPQGQWGERPRPANGKLTARIKIYHAQACRNTVVARKTFNCFP